MKLPSRARLVKLIGLFVLVTVLYRDYLVFKLAKIPVKDDEAVFFNPQIESSSNKRNSFDSMLPRVLAIYFPQFHRDALNDRLWGEGFTDWTTLKSSPRKNRLNQTIPHPLKEFGGYYDLSHTDIRKRQGELAKKYKIDGFIYHHYWFNDPAHLSQPNLHLPLTNMLKDGYPDIPFFLNWVCVKWSATWNTKSLVKSRDGVLQNQYFNKTDESVAEYYKWLRPFFHHKNYIKINGTKPVFMLYVKKPGTFEIIDKLRKLVKQDGFDDLYIIMSLYRPHEDLNTKLFQKIPPAQYQKLNLLNYNRFQKALDYPQPHSYLQNETFELPSWCLDTGNITALASKQISKYAKVEIPGIVISFDNTPRRGLEHAFIWSEGGTEEILAKFKKNLEVAVYYEACCILKHNEIKKDDDSRFIVLNAWNEWAESMVLEPSDVYKTRFLEIVRQVKENLNCNNIPV